MAFSLCVRMLDVGGRTSLQREDSNGDSLVVCCGQSIFDEEREEEGLRGREDKVPPHASIPPSNNSCLIDKSATQ